jgi:cytochrome c2
MTPGCDLHRRLARVLCAAALLTPLAATAAGDPAEGRKLVESAKCEQCHRNKTMGDAKAIYLRKDRKVTSWEKLKAQVAACNTQLNLGLFPEDEEHIAAFLNQTYYKFAVK